MARRVSRDDYFTAAMDLLAEDGYPALKQATLCGRLGVTTGSFYTHFASWQDFTGQLLAQWRYTRTLEIIAAAAEANGPIEELLTLRELAQELPYRAEGAIRAWSLTDPDVARVQRQVDRERLGAVRHAMDQMFTDPDVAELWARTAVYLLIGFEQFETHPHNTKLLFWSLDRVLELIDEQRDR